MKKKMERRRESELTLLLGQSPGTAHVIALPKCLNITIMIALLRHEYKSIPSMLAIWSLPSCKFCILVLVFLHYKADARDLKIEKVRRAAFFFTDMFPRRQI